LGPGLLWELARGAALEFEPAAGAKRQFHACLDEARRAILRPSNLSFGEAAIRLEMSAAAAQQLLDDIRWLLQDDQMRRATSEMRDLVRRGREDSPEGGDLPGEKAEAAPDDEAGQSVPGHSDHFEYLQGLPAHIATYRSWAERAALTVRCHASSRGRPRGDGALLAAALISLDEAWIIATGQDPIKLRGGQASTNRKFVRHALMLSLHYEDKSWAERLRSARREGRIE
jgi:hypothetical protein